MIAPSSSLRKCLCNSFKPSTCYQLSIHEHSEEVHIETGQRNECCEAVEEEHTPTTPCFKLDKMPMELIATSAVDSSG